MKLFVQMTLFGKFVIPWYTGIKCVVCVRACVCVNSSSEANTVSTVRNVKFNPKTIVNIILPLANQIILLSVQNQLYTFTLM